MRFDLLYDNLTNPALLFFILGILAVRLKSDLEIPRTSSQFIALYLLFSIGFKGGQELAHSSFSMDIVAAFIFGVASAIIIPLFTYFILRMRLSIENAGAVAASYGSVSAVTFVTAVSFLEIQAIPFSGHMVAVMAFMEAPAIIVGVILIRRFSKGSESKSLGPIIHHSFTNGSVLLILGSLLIGWVASEEQAAGIEPFTTDIFKGFLAVFLLDMGITSGKKLSAFLKSGTFTTAFAIFMPLVNGCIVALLTSGFIAEIGDRFMVSVLAASASYIAVPAAMKIAAPKANPGIFVPMALAITFPINITIGMPIYLWMVSL
ncbi:MAG: sodium-dependent bicarbonate transport family permease [Bacteroidetes bacterium]|jgi:hypothetical protein|nr:sodium-dependent bicarbonate transport family permease [Bacteroidota bacterium]